MPIPVGHASPENVGFGFLVSYWTLDLCLCSRVSSFARPWSLLTDGIYGVKLPTRTEQLAAKLEKRISST